MTSKEKSKQNESRLVRSKLLTDSEKKAFFGYRGDQMSSRALIYYGPEGESLASFHATVLNEVIPLLDGIPGEIEVFGNGDRKFYIGFKSVLANIDQSVLIANKELDKLAIPRIPDLPSLDSLIPDWLKS
jgi:hypothetical protein